MGIFVFVMMMVNFFLGAVCGISIYDIRECNKQEKEYEFDRRIKEVVNKMQEHN